MYELRTNRRRLFFALMSECYSVFMGPSHVEDPEQLKYLNILFDFAYLKNPEDFENMVNSNTVSAGPDQEESYIITKECNMIWLYCFVV